MGEYPVWNDAPLLLSEVVVPHSFIISFHYVDRERTGGAVHMHMIPAPELHLEWGNFHVVA